MTRILAFTDVHCDKKAVEIIKRKAIRADICVCAGDFSMMGAQTKSMLTLFNKLGKEVLLIPGNHEDEKEVKQYCKKLEHVTFIHRTYVEREGIIFVGYGGGGFDDRDLGFEAFIEKTTLPRGKRVLVTHQPPYKTTLDELDGPKGSKSYRTFAKRYVPLLHICGHLHENEGKEDNIGKTKVVNPGKKGKIIIL